MSTIYIGVDFHARQQTVCSLKTDEGVVVTHHLEHQDKDEVRAFYQQFSGRVIVGIEASGYSPWFEQLVEELGHEVWARGRDRDSAPGRLAPEERSSRRGADSGAADS